MKYCTKYNSCGLLINARTRYHKHGGVHSASHFPFISLFLSRRFTLYLSLYSDAAFLTLSISLSLPSLTLTLTLSVSLFPDIFSSIRKMSRSRQGSNNDSSESDDPFDWQDPEWGVPTKCFCGHPVFLGTESDPEKFGVKYYMCPKAGDGKMHIEKYWDQAVDEEFHKMETILTEQDKSIKKAFRYGGSANPVLLSLKRQMREMRLEIGDLKEQLLQKDNEISQIKAYLGIR